jgi:hypothetical protein
MNVWDVKMKVLRRAIRDFELIDVGKDTLLNGKISRFPTHLNRVLS